MTEYHQGYTYRSTVTEKQGRRIKNHHHKEVCKCFPPFVKLHHHNCPVVMKPCPIHGNLFQNTEKGAKNRKQNVIISFHPSSKTEKLLQPIKSLLANCNSDTKINFQYYSPSNSASKESLKPSPSLTAYENLKKSLNNNALVEKTKSFVADKKNKVKKLRQCFHSPCNSIAQKTRSYTSVQEKLNLILREEANQNRKLYNMVPEIPPNDKKSETGLKWLYANGLDLRNKICEEPLDKKRDSDFITVTQRDKNNVVNHKIFEIKHKKDLNDLSFVGFPKDQSQFVYSSVFGNTQSEYATYQQYGQAREKPSNYTTQTNAESEKFGRKVDEVYSEKSNRSTSSSSVYITPFIFLPKSANGNDSDTHIKDKDSFSLNTKKQSHMQKEPSIPSKQSVDQMTQTTSKMRRSDTKSSSPESDEEPRFISVLIQTDSFYLEKSQKPTKKSKSYKVRDYGEPQKTLEEVYTSEVFIRRDYEVCGCRQNRRAAEPEQSRRPIEPEQNRRSLDSEQKRRSIDQEQKRRAADSEQKRRAMESEQNKRAADSEQNKRAVDVQTGCSCPKTEVLITAKWGLRDQTSQTDDSWKVCLSVKTLESKSNSPFYSQKAIQTSHHSEGSQSETQESLDRDYQNLSYVIKPFDEEESDQTIDKMITWWKKSRSDGDLYEKGKCENGKEGENVNPSTSDYESNEAKSSDTSEMVKTVNFQTKETSTKADFPSTVSDLSELRKLIQEIFEKGDFGPKKTCDCNGEKTKTGKMDSETMTDISCLKPKNNLVHAEVQTINPKSNAEVQTSVHLLMDETQQKPGQKINLQPSVTEDQLSDSKTYYVCALCGGEIKSLLPDVSTNEHASQGHPKKTEKTTVVESAYTERVQVRLLKNCQCGTDKNSIELREKHKRSSPKQRTQEKSNIPVPLPPQSGSIRFRTTDNGCKITEIETRSTSHRPPGRSLNQEDGGEASTGGNPGKSRGAKKQSKVDDCLCPTRTESQELHGNKSRRRNTDFILPVLINPFWAKDLMQMWKPKENQLTDNDSDNCFKSPISKQKRSYEKDEPIETAAGKKIKVELEEPPREYIKFVPLPTNKTKGNPNKKNPGVLWVPFSSTLCLKNESLTKVKSRKSEKSINNSVTLRNFVQNRRFNRDGQNPFLRSEHPSSDGCYVQVWPEDMNPQDSKTAEEESSVSIDEVLDEEIPQKLPRENSLENEEEFNTEGGRSSDSNSSPRTPGTNVFEDYTAEEFGELYLEPYYQKPETKPQSHTVLMYEKSFQENVNPSSKSLNTLWFEEDPKKQKSNNNKKHEK